MSKTSSPPLSVKTKKTLDAARIYAEDMHHSRVNSSHVSIALISDHSGTVSIVLDRLGENVDRLERQIHNDLKRKVGHGGYFAAELDAAMHIILEDAVRQAQREKFPEVMPHHLFLAIIDGPAGSVKDIFKRNGITRNAVVFMLKKVLPEKHVKSAAKSDTNSDPKKTTIDRSDLFKDLPLLQEFSRDLTKQAADGKLDPVVGRDAEIRRVMQILGRRTKNNPVLIGEAGVGKTAIVEGFVQRLASGDVPSSLKGRSVVVLDLGALVAGTTLRGQFEERVKNLVDEVKSTAGQIILYVDELHTMVSSGGGKSGGAGNLLKPALARGEITIIGTTTPAEYRSHIEKDKALERRFQAVPVGQSSVEESVAILRGIKRRYEIHHRVQIKDDAIQAAVKLSSRYVTDRMLPDKAIDVIDEAASRLRMEFDSLPKEFDEMKRKMLDLELEFEALKSETSASAVRERSKIETTLIDLRERLAGEEKNLQAEKEIVDRLTELKAEEEATQKLVEQARKEGNLGRAAELKYGVIKELERELKRATEELSALQGTGKRLHRESVGEAAVAEVIAAWTGIPVAKMMEGERKKLLAIEDRLSKRVVGQEYAVKAIAAAVRRSRAGLQDRNRPIGNFFFVGPTGVGKTELAKALAEQLFDSEDALIRIDMSEYMEQSKVNTLIGAAYGYVDSDKGGILTEAVRRRPYSVVLFDEAEKAHPDVFNILLQVLDEGRLTDSQGRKVDFTNTIIIMTSNVGAREILDYSGKTSYKELDKIVHRILQKHFKPEFLNRLDDTVVFNALNRTGLVAILTILERKLNKLLAEQGLHIRFTDDAREHIITVGFQPEYGARPLKRALLTEVQDPLALKLLEEAFTKGDTILASYDPKREALTFRKK